MQASLSWGAATDNIGVVRYNVYRSTTSGFSPSTANRIAQPTGTSYTNTGVAAGTYYYKVRAEDAAGNLGAVSNQASAVVTADTTPASVSITSPAAGATLSGAATLSADASDNIGVAGVQFKVDGVNLGAEDTSAPYEASWNTFVATNGSHTITAVARDAGGNLTTSSPITITVSNTSVSPVGLRAIYALNESSGSTAADWSGNGNNGTDRRAPRGRAVCYGNAASFDGTSDRINLPALGTFYNAGFTYEAWVRKTSAKKDVMVLGTWVSAQSGGPMIWIDHIAGRYYLTLGSGSISTYLDSGRTPTVGQWEHIAATYDGSTARFYVGGVQVASKTYTGVVGNSNTWRMGAYESTPTGFFDGQIDNVRIYDRALSAGEIQVDMSNPVLPETTPPTVTAVTPATGAEGINAGTAPTAKFSEAMSQSSITTATVQLEGRLEHAGFGDGLVRRGREDREGDASRGARVRCHVHRDRQGRLERREGRARQPPRRRCELVLLDGGVSTAAARDHVDRETVRRLPERDPQGRGPQRLHGDRRRIPLTCPAELVRRRSAR